MDSKQTQESKERSKESQGSDKYGSGPGSSSPGPTRVQSNTPENRTGAINPSAPTEATEGPSTNLAHRDADSTELGTTRGEPARGETKNEGTIKKPSSEKHDAA
ncbi:MAG: hypothetical protein JOZ10_09200 [Acidobacteria bacterium]|nr:hypothetical protein [Acidobacteriota bacterium]MBV9146164.1 hypothetical protein [Acidobacteriota bacterium]